MCRPEIQVPICQFDLASSVSHPCKFFPLLRWHREGRPDFGRVLYEGNVLRRKINESQSESIEGGIRKLSCSFSALVSRSVVSVCTARDRSAHHQSNRSERRGRVRRNR